MKHSFRSIIAAMLAAVIAVQPVYASAEDEYVVSAQERLDELNALAEDSTDCEVGVFGIEISDDDAEFMNSVVLSDYAAGEESIVDNGDLDLSANTTKYFYSQLSAEEKTMYNDLYSACAKYAADRSTDYTAKTTEYVSRPSSVDDARLRVIINAFYFSNPQFYFIKNGYYYSSSRVALMVEEDMAAASTRNSYGDRLETITEELIAGASGMTDDLEIETYIFEYLVDRIDYVKTGYHQSMAGALVDGKCVCNGYAMSMQYLCTALGLDSVGVVGQNHAWNRVKLYGNWYEIDVTWMDQGGVSDIWYKWCNKSHATILSQDTQHNSNAHTVESTFYVNLDLPDCNYDTVQKPASDDSVKINATNFPDSTFRSYVSDNFDTDGSGTLSESEIAAVKKIDVSDKGISDLTGVEYFTELTTLYCSDNNLSFLEVGANKKLTSLWFNGNKNIISLDLSKNTALTELAGYDTSLISVDLSNNTALQKLYLHKTNLDSIDLSNHTRLTNLWVNECRLTSLDVSKNTKLEELICNDNELTALNVSANSALTKLWAHNNAITSISLINCSSLGSLSIGGNALTRLDLSRNTVLTELWCAKNNLVALDISNNTSLKTISATDNVYTLTSASLGVLTPGGFKAANASNWTGAEYDSSKNALKNITADVVTYDYNIGRNTTVTFSLKIGFTPDAAKPALPKLTVVAGDSSAQLSWTAVDGATTYRVFKITDGVYTKVLDYNKTSGLTVGGLTNGKTYGFIVLAVNGDTVSDYTDDDIVYVTPKAPAPASLALPKLTVVAGDSSAQLSWTAVDGAETYRIYTIIDGVTKQLGDRTGTSVNVTGLTNGKSYGFIVLAVNGAVVSEYTNSDIVYVTPKAPAPTRLDLPKLTAVAGNGTVTLTWTAVDNAEFYRAYIIIDEESFIIDDYEEPAEVTLTDLTNGKTYGFLVLAVNGDVFSDCTDDDIVYVTPKAPEADPTKPVVTAEPTYGGAEVTWEPVDGAINYRVFTFVPGQKIRQFGSDTKGTSMTVKGLKGGEKTGIIVLAQFANKKWSTYTDDDIAYVIPLDAVKPYLCVNPKGNGSYYLIWSSVPTSVRYKVMAREKGTNNWELIGATRQRCRITVQLDPNKEYEFLVRGLNAKNKYTPMDADDIVSG